MLNLLPSNLTHQSVLDLLQQHPMLAEELAIRLGQSVSQVATLIEPVLQAARGYDHHYIHAVVIAYQAFLITNLANPQTVLITNVASTWVAGRSRSCAINMPQQSVSRCHAVIGYMHSGQFYIMDLGSSNGTRLNQKRLKPLKRYALESGDTIDFCNVRSQFLLSELSELPDTEVDTMF